MTFSAIPSPRVFYSCGGMSFFRAFPRVSAPPPRVAHTMPTSGAGRARGRGFPMLRDPRGGGRGGIARHGSRARIFLIFPYRVLSPLFLSRISSGGFMREYIDTSGVYLYHARGRACAGGDRVPGSRGSWCPGAGAGPDRVKLFSDFLHFTY